MGTVALYQRDLFLLYFPLVQSALRGLSEGALPLRDPTSAFGQPLLADPSCQILYPPVLLHLLFPPHLAYAWFVSLHSVFGALGVAMLAQRISQGSWLSAAVGGAAWLLCGPLQSLATLWHHMSGAAWIPWVLLGVVRVQEKEPRAIGGLGAAFGLQILAGSADMCAMTVLLSVLFIPPPAYFRAARGLLLSLATALALSAGVWLPAMEILSASARAALSETTRTSWSLHPVSLLELFLPVPLAAFPLRTEWRQALFEGREPFLGSVFLGSLILPLALAALADSRIPRLRRLACALGAIGALLVSLGKNAAAYPIAVALIPPLKILRFPSKAVIPAAILLCVLAGLGASSLGRSQRARRVAVVTATLLAAVGLVLRGPLWEAFVGAFLDPGMTSAMSDVRSNLPPDLLVSASVLVGLALSTWGRLGRFGPLIACVLAFGHLSQSIHIHSGLNPTLPSRLLGYKPPHLDLLRPSAGGRIYVYDYFLFEGRAQKYLTSGSAWEPTGLDGLSPDAAALVATRASLLPLTGALWNLDYAWDADLRLLFDRRLAALTGGLRRVEGTPGFLKLLQISGVQKVAARHEQGMEDLGLLSRHNVFQAQELRVFAVPGARPRVFLTSGRRQGTGRDLSDLIDPGFDPQTTVLVDSGPFRDAAPNFAGTAVLLQRRADRFAVEVKADQPSFLVALEGRLPGWRAWVDGVSTRVERANAAFIGVEVPAGAHRVDFRYLPTTAVAGVLVSAITALLLAFTLLRPATPNGTPEGMLGDTA